MENKFHHSGRPAASPMPGETCRIYGQGFQDGVP